MLFDSHINLEHISPHQYSFVLIKREQNNYHFIKEMALPPKSLDKHHYLLAINMPNTKSIISQLKKNQTFIIKTSLNSKQDNTPLHLKSHISGGTPLIYHGVNVTQNIQNLASYRSKAHPRTALGINQKENTITWIVVDGRSEFSKGVNYTDLAQLFVENNCDSAINLDGGGSSVLWLNGEIKNNPSDKKGTRPCLNYLLLSQ